MEREIIIYSDTYTHKEINELTELGYSQCGNILSINGNNRIIPDKEYDVIEIFPTNGDKSTLQVKNINIPTFNGFVMYSAYVYFNHKNKTITMISPVGSLSRSINLYLKAFHPKGHYAMKDNIDFVASLINYKINDITDTLDIYGNIMDVLTRNGYPFFHEYTNSPFRLDGPGKFVTADRFPIILDIVNFPSISNWIRHSYLQNKSEIFSL